MKTAAGLAVMLFLLSFAAGCSKNDASPGVDAVSGATSSLRGLSAELGHFVDARRKKPVDFPALKKIYEKNLKNYVAKADEFYGTKLTQTVHDALENGARGIDIHANVQRAEKNIQRAFILDFTISLDQLAGRTGRETDDALLARIKASAPLIRSIAERRGAWVKKGNEYSYAFDLTMKDILKAAKDKNAEGLRSGKARMDALVNRLLVLSVFYELEGLEKAVKTDPGDALEKLVEVQIYYQSLYEECKKWDALAAETIVELLEKSPEQVDLQAVRILFKDNFRNELLGVDPVLLGFVEL